MSPLLVPCTLERKSNFDKIFIAQEVNQYRKILFKYTYIFKNPHSMVTFTQSETKVGFM